MVSQQFMTFNYAENRLEILLVSDLMVSSKQIWTAKALATAIFNFPFLFGVSAQ
jgi:hypothetical protein